MILEKRKPEHLILLGSSSLAILIFIFDIQVPLGVAGAIPYVSVIFMGLWVKDRRYIYFAAIICSLLTLLGFIFSPSSDDIWKAVINRSLSIFVIFVTAFICLLQKPVSPQTINPNANSALIFSRAALFSLFLLIASGFTVWFLGNQFIGFNANNIKLQKLSGSIVHLDEVLTMSARMGAATGENAWETRYLVYEKELENILQQTIEKLPKTLVADDLIQVKTADELVKLEKQAFSLTRQGKKTEASRILFNEEYKKLKTVYGKGIEKFLKSIDLHLNKETQKLKERVFQIIYVVGLIFLVGWLLVLTLARKNQESLREAEEKYMRLFSAESNAVAIFDAKTRLFVEVNQSALDFFGFRSDEIVHMRATDVSIEPEIVEKDFNEIIAGEVQEIPLRFIKNKNGTVYSVELSTGVFFQGNHQHVFIIYKDITERRNALAQIESLSKFPSENPNPVMRVKKNGELLYANSSAIEILKSFNCKTGDKVPENFGTIIKEAVSTNSAKSFVDEFLGSFYLLDILPIEDKDYINVYGKNITDLKCAEKALLESQQQLQAIVSGAMDGIVTISFDGRVESFNPAAEKIFGYASSEIIGKQIGLLMPEPFRSEHNNYIQKYIQTGQGSFVGIAREVSALHKNGYVFPLEISISELIYEKKRSFMGIVRDISERKAVETENLQYSNDLKKANEELEKFTYTASHDLQEPLRKMVLFNDLLEKSCHGKLDSNELNMLQRIKKSSYRMKLLIEDLLGYSLLNYKGLRLENINLNILC